MAAGLSALVDAYHPQIAKLRHQLEGLVPERAAAVAKEVVANPSTLLGHVSANAPLLMELGSSFLHRMRHPSEQAVEAANAKQRRRSWIGRIGYGKSALAITVALGAAYLVGRSHRRTEPRLSRVAHQPERSRADLA